MHRRLLLATGGGGGTATAPTATAYTITSAPEGSWTGPQEPKGVQHNGRTYIGYINGSTGAVKVVVVNNTTKASGTPIQIDDLGTPDNHDAPSLLVRASDHRLLIAYCRHDGPTMYTRLSTTSLDTDPDLADGFASRIDHDAQLGTNDYTYPTLYQLRDVSGAPIYLFYRDYSHPTGRLAMSTSTDGGATFATRTLLQTGASGKVPYWRITSDAETRIDIFTTDDAPNAGASLYHFYIDGTDGSRHKTDGTTISAALPITTADMTLVMSQATNGSIACMGAGFDGSKPFCSLMTDTGSDSAVYQPRWTGSAWQVDQVISAVGGIFGGNQYASGSATHHENPNVAYLSRLISGQWELFRYTTTDSGASWSGSQITTSSASANVWVDAVSEPAVGLEVMWLFGTYTSDTNNSFGLRGYG